MKEQGEKRIKKDSWMEKIMEALYSCYGMDFSMYKESTIIRRIERRAAVSTFGNLEKYLELFMESEEEKEELCKAVFIGVTSFFRDEEAFQTLREKVLLPLLHSEKEEFRIWSAACSTGEEPYSIALLLRELSDSLGIHKSIKIFATDIDRAAIEKAKKGIYQEEELEMIPQALKNKYFDKTDQGYHVSDSIRAMIVFAHHNLLQDAPFSRMDLVVCRNVFIYLKQEIQKRILKIFYRILNPDGYLLIGSSESLGELSEIYGVVDKQWNLYQKSGQPLKGMGGFHYTAVKTAEKQQVRRVFEMTAENQEEQGLLARILKEVLESAVLLDENGKILHILKNSDRFFRLTTGQFDTHISSYLTRELGLLAESVVYEIKSEQKKTALYRAEELAQYPGEAVYVRADRIPFREKDYFLLQIYSEAAAEKEVLEVNKEKLKEIRILELEKQLNESRKRLGIAIGELKIKNEELKLSNEEMIVSNEELQSTNEELQSVNGELSAMNREYQKKIEELVKANADFNNLLLNAEIGALFIDEKMKIRKLTPIIEMTTNLLPSDIGRPIFHVKFMDKYPKFHSDIRRVAIARETIEKEVADRNQVTWLVRIRPYNAGSERLEGIIVTIFDITKRLEAAKYEMKLLMNSIPGGVTKMRYDRSLILEYANEGFYGLGLYTETEFRSYYNNCYEKVMYPEDWETLQKKIKRCVKTGELLKAEYRVKTKEGKERWRLMHAMVLEESDTPVLQAVVSDITNLKHTVQALEKEREKLKKREIQLRIQAERDLMTGVYNQLTVKQLIKKEIENARDGACGALMIIDIDNFKMVNDTMGHLFGDAIICSIADEISKIFCNGEIIGRIGGDEFIVYIQEIQEEDLKEKARRLQEQIHKIYTGEDRSYQVSCSIGIVRNPDHRNIYEELFKKADMALYYVKSKGKDSFELFRNAQRHGNFSGYSTTMNRVDFNEEHGNQLAKSAHPLILFALELLEKTRDTKNAVNMVLDRICRYYNMDGMVMTKLKNSWKVEKSFQWMLHKAEVYGKNNYEYDLEAWKHLQSHYDENGIAEFTEEEIALNEKFHPGAKSMLAVSICEKGTQCGYITFLDKKTNRVWSREEKEVLKSLAFILYTQLDKLVEIQQKTEKLNAQIHMDAITGLPNFAYFKELAEKQLEEFPLKQYYLIYSDFTNFKFINESYGYVAGDRILNRFAKCIREQGSSYITCSRITSDAFAVLVTGKEVASIISQYLEICRSFCKDANKQFKLSNLIVISGVSKIDPCADNALSAAVDNANMARKSIKHIAETNCVEFTPSMKEQLNAEMEMTAKMVNSLEKGEFVVYLQPKISLKDEKIVGAEALVRWKTGEGMIPPDKFIPLFEKNGFITKIDFYVFEQVLAYLKRQLSIQKQVVPVSVNFSRRHQENDNFVSEVKRVMERYEVPAHLVEIEITESVFMNDAAKINENLRRLQCMGLLVSIDDFGAGYSSLNLLSTVSANIIKLDRQFLDQESKQAGRTLLMHLLPMIKSLGFQVIAEGVETAEQAAMLKAGGCDMAQGYYFAEPMPMEKFEYEENEKGEIKGHDFRKNV